MSSARTLFFVPGHRSDRFGKAVSRGAVPWYRPQPPLEVPSIEGVRLGVGDNDQLSRDMRHAACLGCGGKLCIHPRQVAHTHLAPPQPQIPMARRTVNAAGRGAMSPCWSGTPAPPEILSALSASTSFANRDWKVAPRGCSSGSLRPRTSPTASTTTGTTRVTSRDTPGSLLTDPWSRSRPCAVERTRQRHRQVTVRRHRGGVGPRAHAPYDIGKPASSNDLRKLTSRRRTQCRINPRSRRTTQTPM